MLGLKPCMGRILSLIHIYIAEGDNIESTLEKIANFWFLDKTILISLYKNHIKEFSNAKTAACYTKSYMLPALIYKIKKQEAAI